MAPNPFLLETRSDVVSTHLTACEKLRMPSSLHRLLKLAKPQHISTADYLLKSALDQYLLHQISDGRYDLVQDTLAALFGPDGHGTTREATGVACGNGTAR